MGPIKPLNLRGTQEGILDRIVAEAQFPSTYGNDEALRCRSAPLVQGSSGVRRAVPNLLSGSGLGILKI